MPSGLDATRGAAAAPAITCLKRALLFSLLFPELEQEDQRRRQRQSDQDQEDVWTALALRAPRLSLPCRSLNRTAGG